MRRKEDTETGIMFPDLDNTKPEHKELLRLARAFNKRKLAHLEGISELKTARDEAANKLLAKLHELKMPGFKHDGVKVSIEAGGEKVKVKIEEEGGEEGDEDAGESEGT